MKKQEYYNTIKKIFKRNNGYARTKEIVDAGVHKHYLYQLVEDNKISRVKRGLYSWNNHDIDTQKELLEVKKLCPKVLYVFCQLCHIMD